MLADVRAWPEWWPGVESVAELDPGDERQVGSRYRVRWRSATRYGVEFEFSVDEVREPAGMSGRASGDLEGTGKWRLFDDDGVTAVTYAWEVRAARAWMRALGPLARPVFRRNHDRLMAAGGRGLAQRLGTRLLGGG